MAPPGGGDRTGRERGVLGAGGHSGHGTLQHSFGAFSWPGRCKMIQTESLSLKVNEELAGCA